MCKLVWEKKSYYKEIAMLKKKSDQKKCANLCGKKIILKEITMLKKNLTKQNVQTVLAVGPRKNSKN